MGRRQDKKPSRQGSKAPVQHPIADDTWDEVDQASWESFPASDSPGWAAPDSDRPKPSRPKPPDGSDPADRHA